MLPIFNLTPSEKEAVCFQEYSVAKCTYFSKQSLNKVIFLKCKEKMPKGK